MVVAGTLTQGDGEVKLDFKMNVKGLQHRPCLGIAILVLWISIALFVLLPLAKVLHTGLMVDGRLSFAPVWEVFSKSYNRQPFYNSMMLGAATAVLGTIIGFIFAYAITRTDLPLKGFFRTIATVPIISPPFVISLSIILLLGRNGLITRGLLGLEEFDIYGFKGLLLAETLAYFPIAFLILSGVLQALDPALEDAALNLGASKGRVFWKVTLPLTIPGIASSLLLLFAESVADFGNPLILGGDFHVLTLWAYLKIVGEYDLVGGSVMAILLLFPALTAFVLQRYWVSRRFYVTVTGKPSAIGLRATDPAVKYPLFLACLLLVFSILTVYGIVVIGALTKSWGIDYSLTTEHLTYSWAVGREAIKDTLLLALASTPITALLGIIIAYLVTRERFPGRGVLEFSSMLTFVLPGTVVGISYVLAFNTPPLLLTGTAWILILCFIFRNLPVGIRAGVSSLQQIDRSLEEASLNLGATGYHTFRRIILPLISSAFFSGLVYSFVRCMTAISAIIFLVSARWRLLTPLIMDQVEIGRIGVAASLSLILILLVLLALSGFRFLVGRIEARALMGFQGG